MKMSIRRSFGRLAAPLLAALVATVSPADAQSDELDRLHSAALVLEEIMNAPDGGIPPTIRDAAAGLVVFPSTIKGAFVVGAQRGKGVITARDPETGQWSPPAFLTLTGGSFGFQIGGQATDVVLVIMNERGVENMMSNTFTLGGEAAVSAGPVGREAEASTDYAMRAQILGYSRSRGLFAGLSLEGSTIRADRDANEAIYGVGYNTGQIVLEQMGGTPDAVGEFLTAVREEIGGAPVSQ